jgi:hypothetical protein
MSHAHTLDIVILVRWVFAKCNKNCHVAYEQENARTDWPSLQLEELQLREMQQMHKQSTFIVLLVPMYSPTRVSVRRPSSGGN